MFSVIGLVAWGMIGAPLLYGPETHAQHNEYTQQTTNTSGDQNKPKEPFWERATDDPVAVFTLCLVIFTFVLAASTIGLWIVTGRGVRTQIADTRVLQRAYIAVSGGGILPLKVGSSVAHLIVRNTGNLPARDVSWFIKAEIDKDGRRVDFPISEDRFYGNNVLPPRTDMARSQQFLVLPTEHDDFGTGHRLIYVWGEIRYTDGFGERRYTRFCHRYGRSGLLRQVTEAFQGGARTVREEQITAESMRYHQFGNDAD